MARGPQLRSAPLALPSVRDATHCVIFALTFNTQLRFHILLISTPPDLCTSAPPPSPQPSSRGIVGRRLRQLRSCVADFPHSASHSLQSCGVVRVCLSFVGWPSVRLTPFLRAGRSVRGFGSRRGQPRSPFFHLSASRILHTYSCFSHTCGPRPSGVRWRSPLQDATRCGIFCLDSRGGCPKYKARPARRAP